MLTGLILTDTQRLASTLSSNQRAVVEIIETYVSSCATYINWQTIDLSDAMYSDLDKTDWLTYLSVLNDYYIGLGLQDRSYCPLFIIGGNDIVPMPRIQNPSYSYGREFLDVDMAYCFDSYYLNIEDFICQKPRFAVGRLPLTSDWRLNDLVEYLSCCVNFSTNGLPIRGAVMTSTESWIRASQEMMMDIPTVTLSEDYVPLNNKMIVSPLLDTDDNEWYEGYVHELKKVDFLVCNLHGCKEDDSANFFGEDRSDSEYKPTAVQPSMLEYASPYIFNTVACYGGRYIDYDTRVPLKREASMMQSSLAHGTMLYCGSCDTAYGGCIDGEAYGSELMIRLYNIYLHKGLPAGLALIKAKQDFYRACHDVEGDNDAMFTVLEFNLFGCPLLSMQPKLSDDYEPQLLGRPIVGQSNATYRPKTTEIIWGGAYNANNIHDYVRGLVDYNLSIIKEKIEIEVYQRLGLGKDNLQQIMRVWQGCNEVGYQFLYTSFSLQLSRHLQTTYIVATDCNGKITKMTQSK